MYDYKATVERVVDGDTIEFNVDLGFRIYSKIMVRLLNVDTPEVYGVKHDSDEYRRGKIASANTQSWLDEKGPIFFLTTEKGTGKYGRWLAIVKPLDGSKSLNDVILETVIV
jgi:micrococcal nuclease